MSNEPYFTREFSVFYDGEWHRGSGNETLQVTNPADGEVISILQCGNAADVECAASAAERAFAGWSETPGVERANYLQAIADGLQARFDRLVEVQMTVNGKPRVESEIDVSDAIASFSYYAGLAREIDAGQNTQVNHAGGAHTGYVRHDPIGPVGLIVPWNFPLVTSAWKIAPALAAGCTVVMKTSEMTPLIELVYADIAVEIGLPAGVINIVTGAAEVGMAITAARQFRKISFTGSNMIGARVMEAVSKRCLPIALELGGKSPIIVTEDADIANAVECVMGGIFFNAGQMCSATSRLIAHETVASELMDALIAKTETLKTGSPFATDTDMGPITTAKQCQTVADYLSGASSDGLDCVIGGSLPKEQSGNFVEPTIYRNVPHENRIWNEEIFGPVLATTTYSSDEEALQIANATQYGLVGSVVSGDMERGQALAAKIEAGQIWVNTPQIVYPDSAWGGFKQSGIGRELGPWGLSAYQGVKHITIPVR